ncbi:cell division protein FtsK [Actinorhabdospora filicis]|uniref:Cell division protein FtsK n=1 Tax=Actinorhabdospora filicis TaxID=1785913 RepID=A0A9W6W662_9ACTN|nr:FtsK/SpoIIIE domain-containing protein [Actinorhabdospora filicis]GLZ81187.1 cell division protein FtsK [Actinorhabdospora filicis]
MLLRLTVRSSDTETEALVEADPAATVASVAAGLADAAGSAHTALFVGDLPALPDVPWSEAGLRDGMRVGLGAPVRAEPRRPGTVELAVTCGPGAGLAHRLRPGEYRAGDAPGVHVPLPVPEFRLRIDRSGECAVRVSAEASLDERPLKTDEWTKWPYATPLNLGGDHRLEVAPLPAPDAAVRPSEDGFGLDFNRPPRLHPPDRTTRFRLPSPPTAPEGRGALPMLPMLLVPLVGSVAMVGVTKNYQFLFLALLGPVAMLGNMLLQNRQGWKRFKQQQRKYEETKRRIEDDATLALRAERAARRAAHPDPAAVLRTATGPYGRLWERRRRDPDFLSLRVGLAELPSEVVLEDPTRDEHRRKVTWRIPDVPVALPVREHGVVGLAGEYVDELASWLVAQAAAWHSPTDLQIYLLAGQGGEKRWSWASHLPHVRHDRPGFGLTRIGSDAESLGRRVSELGALVQQRGQRGAPPGEPEVLVVLDGARRLRALPGVIDLLRSGPAVGVHFLCVDTAVRELPEEATAVVIAGRDGLEVRRMKVDTITGVLADEPAPGWFDRFARALAPVRDTGGDEEDVLPGSVRLLDLLSLEPPTVDGVNARWALSGGGTTRAVIGATMDGDFAIDLDRDGPHGLIAGTTGSGKSELLQTIVASLAVANRPDELNFVLVDYKGGSAFAEAAALPHTVGMVTDLHQFEATRALSSLGAELTRREHVLATVAAKDLPDYRRKRGESDPPLPRLLLVIDEFGTLARQLPDFVSGLVNLAQRGRSLGIHLLLATQRPAGVVTGDIRANTNLRIALRVTDPADSRDVIDAPDAAAIGPSQAGRGYARLDSSSLLPFQTARVGGRRPAATSSVATGAPVVRALTWRDLGASVKVAFDERELMAETDLKALVEAITAAASSYEAPFRPWLPPLATGLTLASLPAPEGRRVAYGLIDLPAEQEQRPLWFDLDRDGHLHLVGSPGSGRTQALRTLAGALAALPPSAVQFHGIDCGNGGLLELTALPHTGAIAQRTETDRVVRLLERLTTEVGERQKLMARAGAAHLSELPSAPAHLVVFIDRWEMFLQTFAGFNHGEPVETVLDLLREGASVGVHIVISGDRSLSAARFSATTPDRLVLHQYDRGDYVTAGLQGKRVPLDMPPGRAIRVADHAEIQLALLTGDASGPAQGAALRELASRHGVPSVRPWAVDALPDVLSFDAAWDYVPQGSRNGLYALAGIGGDSLSAVGADLSVTPTFMVAGPPRSGRSGALLVAARSLLAQGAQLLLVTPRPSPLRSLSHENVVGVLDGPNPPVEEFRAPLARMTAPTGVVIVDDADLLLHADVGADLQRIAKGGAGQGWALIAGGTTEALLGSFHGWQVDMRRNRQGMVLSPQAQSDGEVVGIRVPHGVVGPRVIPGKGHVHLGDGRLVTVRVPVS